MADFTAQFRKPKEPFVYMGGAAMSCGQHPSLPKRHRWGPWRRFTTNHGAGFWERMCLACALMSDMQFTKPRHGKFAPIPSHEDEAA